MTEPKNIGDVAPPGQGGDYPAFTPKRDLAGVPLLLTDARDANGPHGAFIAVSATREDTGEEIAFTGATVVDGQLRKVREENAFPVRAALAKQEGENGSYWLLVNPPSGKVSRVQEVKELIDSHGLTAEAVKAECHQIREGAKVDDLTDEEYGKLLDSLHELAAEKAADAEIPF